MRAAFAALLVTCAVGAAHAAPPTAGEVEQAKACQTRQIELTKQADQYSGEPMMKRIIQADLQRATRELIEGDADECMEALDHATKLLSGQM